MTLKAGIYLVVATWHRTNIHQHMKHISKLFIVMDETQHSGAPSVFFIIKSTNIEMPLMHTVEQFV
jgi:hypothetical protein